MNNFDFSSAQQILLEKMRTRGVDKSTCSRGVSVKKARSSTKGVGVTKCHFFEHVLCARPLGREEGSDRP